MHILMEEKVRTPYLLIASVAPFGWNNLSETLLVAIYQSLTSIWRKFSPLLNAESFQQMLEGFVACTARFKSPHSISLGLRSGLWLGYSRTLHFLVFSQSLVDLLVCFGSLSCCKVQFRFSFNSSDGFTCSSSTLWYRGKIHGGFYDGELARSCCNKASPNHDTSTSMLFLVWGGFVWFTPNMSSVLVSKWFTFRLICPKNIIPEVTVYVLSGKHQLMFFLKEQSFPPCTPLMKVKLVSSLSDSTIMHFHISSCNSDLLWGWTC